MRDRGGEGGRERGRERGEEEGTEERTEQLLPTSCLPLEGDKGREGGRKGGREGWKEGGIFFRVCSRAEPTPRDIMPLLPVSFSFLHSAFPSFHSHIASVVEVQLQMPCLLGLLLRCCLLIFLRLISPQPGLLPRLLPPLLLILLLQ